MSESKWCEPNWHLIGESYASAIKDRVEFAHKCLRDPAFSMPEHVAEQLRELYFASKRIGL